MAQVLITKSYLDDISDAIMEQKNTSSGYKVSQMAAEIRSITNDLFPHAEIPDYVIPLASDFKITEISIYNPPTQYYAVGGTVKVYVR